MSDPPWRRPTAAWTPGVPAFGATTSTRAPEEFRASLVDDVSPEWSWGGATGAGVRVCVVDSGVDGGHPLVGRLDRSVTVVEGSDGTMTVVDCPAADLAGHGTACAGVIRSVAPEASVSSVRVLTDGKTGSGAALIAGLSWAIDEGFDVINLSLATTQSKLSAALHDLVDRAYFRRSALVVSAHNRPVNSYPWSFSSVISVASHDEADPLTYYYNPAPPVEFHARGVRVPVAWPGGGTIRSTGNSFAAPHIAGICALVLSKHPWLTPFQLKTVLFLSASNVAGRIGGAHDAPFDVEATTERRLLQSVVQVARHAFGAAASSVFLIAPDTRELVFEAVAGEGDGQLIGARFPPGTGIAGWVAASGQSMLVDDLRDSPQFSGEAAKSTGYVPNSIMAAPLFSNDNCIGVLEVLDRGVNGEREMADVELLDLLADQAAIGLELLTRLRTSTPNQRSDKALRLLEMAEALLATAHG